VLNKEKIDLKCPALEEKAYLKNRKTSGRIFLQRGDERPASKKGALGTVQAGCEEKKGVGRGGGGKKTSKLKRSFEVNTACRKGWSKVEEVDMSKGGREVRKESYIAT